MPLFSEAASAIKSRFGFHDPPPPSVPSVKGTPNLLKTASSKDSLLQSAASISSIRNIGDETGISRSQSFELDEDPSFWKDHNVQVIIRVRPLNSTELSVQGNSKCVRQESCQTITWTGHPESRFTFDAVADETVTQEKLFKVAGVPMVENCVGGYNSCMFAYGQTGSGKTHTMLGDIEGGTRRHSANCGMTPRVFEYMFQRIQKEKDARREEKLRFSCKCSFLEIYNEQIIDLLDPSSNNLQIREDLKKGVYVENVKEIEVANAHDVMQQLLQGAANRKVAATNMNLASSRSHSVFTCIIESKWEIQGVSHHRFARLNLVDLAGSERQKSSGAEGERLREATNINKSLSTLGLVIMNLVSISNGKSLHVPYRDSKLTFLLQDSLGGNSKTIIIANISPSTCCSAETLSTLKFAQRAKYIKNNAIVNEDASGDVTAMRLQIQQLKKEVARLQIVSNGGYANLNSDTCSVSGLGSPESLKWDGLHGSFSPLTANKRISSTKDYEAALIAAFKRINDKDMSLKALAAENQAALQLAKQRADENRGLKMRLRFREEGIKRLEALASGKISAEAHLLSEKEEYLKELEVLRAQLDKNQEATRFAMENLRLEEEIRRLKSFAEEGERELMQEQISLLQNKLLEALDWKLMHESDTSAKGPGSIWRSSSSEETEFLHMQAIQNQSEIDSLRKKLNNCLEEKEKLERSMEQLKKETQNLSGGSLPCSFKGQNMDSVDQMELKTIVDAIAAASQREAEAHETAFFLSRENDELRVKVKTLLEDNNQLIKLYEQAVAERDTEKKIGSKIDMVTDQSTKDCEVGISSSATKELEMNHAVDNLEHQLADLQEENERLMGLYEEAMQEKDQVKRMLLSAGDNGDQAKMDAECPEELLEIDCGEIERADVLRTLETKCPFNKIGGYVVEGNDKNQVLQHQMEEEAPTNVIGELESDVSHIFSAVVCGADGSSRVDNLTSITEELMSAAMADFSKMSLQAEEDNVTPITEEQIIVENILENLNLARMKLDIAQEKLCNSTETVATLRTLEKAYLEIDRLSREVEQIEGVLLGKQQDSKALGAVASEMQETRALADKKLSALKHSLSNFCSSVAYYEQRVERARGRMNDASSHLNQKKEKLACLQARQDESAVELCKLQQSETEIQTALACLKPRLHAAHESVLMPIDNIEQGENLHNQRNWMAGKATELLKSEEKLVTLGNHIETLNKNIRKMEKEKQTIQTEIQMFSTTFEEMDAAHKQVVLEKEMLIETIESGKQQFESMIIEYQQSLFQEQVKELELQIAEEDLLGECQRLQELQLHKAIVTEEMNQLLEKLNPHSSYISEKLDEELQNARLSISEAKSLLVLNAV